MNKVHYSSEQLFNNFEQLEVSIRPEQNTVWLYFNPKPRPCFTLGLLEELDQFQKTLKNYGGKLPYKDSLIDIYFSVIASKNSVFSFGGDLQYFISCIENEDKESLYQYAKKCIDAIYYNHIGREFDITTISLIQGNALGGGLEAALSSHVIFSEKKSELGFPEVLFNLFPGMGAYNLLLQRMNLRQAEKMILSGRLYAADEAFEMGVVDYLIDNDMGEEAVYDFINLNIRKRLTYKATRKARRITSSITYKSLLEIIDVWVDAAFEISEKDMRVMSRLVSSQEKLMQKENQSYYLA